MQSEACLSKAGSSLYISGNPAIIRTKMKEESNEILVSILRILDKSGFTISQVDSDYCLEIVAKKGSVKLLIKTLENVDDERKESAEDLRSMAATFSASPLVIGSRVQKGVIGESALYERFGINVISPKTFSDAALRGKFPPVYYKRGGLYFRIDGEVLRRLRKERGMSLGVLANTIGVSRKAVYDYENSKMGATLKTVARMEEVLDAGVTMDIDIFDWRCDEEPSEKSPAGAVAQQLHNKLNKIGCKAIGFNYAPIDVHARNVGVSFLAHEERFGERELDRKVEDALEVGKLLEIEPVLITRDVRPKGLNIMILRIDDIQKLEKLGDLKRLLSLDTTNNVDN
jgi:putative transcriptional regulator